MFGVYFYPNTVDAQFKTQSVVETFIEVHGVKKKH